ncbi:hypothetical protein D9M71_582650 [compost metagenome]
MTARGGAVHHLLHHRLDQLTTVGIGHERSGTCIKQYRQTVVRHVPHQLLPARLVQVGHGGRVDAGDLEQRRALLRQRLACGIVNRRPGVVAEVHRTQGLVLDHPGRRTVGADVAEAAEQVQGLRQQRTQFILHGQAVLQQHHLGAGRRGLGDHWSQRGVAGGLGAHQQPIARRHVGSVAIGLGREQCLGAVHYAVQLQAACSHGVVLAAQQEMHVEAGTGQHHAVKAADGAGTDDADARFA